MTDAKQTEQKIENDLLTAGFPPGYARDTAHYVATLPSENAARDHRLTHTDSFMDDLDWTTARAYWDARANGKPDPPPEQLRALATFLTSRI